MPPIGMTIAPETEETVRKAERKVNSVWNAWRQDFDNKTSKEVLAMVAFQFAKLYYLQQNTHEQGRRDLEEFEKELDRLLLIDR